MKTNYLSGRGKRARFSLDGEGQFVGYDFGLRWNGWAIPCVERDQIAAALATVNEGSDHPYQIENRGDDVVIVTTNPDDEPEIHGREYAVLTPSASLTEDGPRVLYSLNLSWVFVEEGAR